MTHPHASIRTYLVVYAALLLLTLTTVLIASKVPLGRWEVPVALGIATVKTVLVALFFMHLLHASRLTQLVAVTGVVFLAFLLAITLADYTTRGWMPAAGERVQTGTE